MFAYVNRCRGSKGTVGPLKEVVCEGRCANGIDCSEVCKKEMIISDPKEMAKVFTDYFQSLQVKVVVIKFFCRFML